MYASFNYSQNYTVYLHNPDAVQLLIAEDLSLDRHVSSVCKTCFFWLHQLRRVCRSLETESLETLVHAFVTSREDYCNSVLASALKTITDELQRVLNAAARLISCTSKYDRGLSALLHDELHWLDIPQRVQYKLAVTVHRVSVFQCLMLPVTSICYPPVAINWLFHVSAAAPSVVAPSLLLVLQSEIHCLTICAIQVLGQTSFNGLWKPTCLPVVSVSLTVCLRCFLRKRTKSTFTYLLTKQITGSAAFS